MEQLSKLKKLKLFLTIYGVVSIILFGGLLLLTSFDASIMQEGGALRFMRWDVLSKHVELMLEAVYLVWGVFMLKAAQAYGVSFFSEFHSLGKFGSWPAYDSPGNDGWNDV